MDNDSLSPASLAAVPEVQLWLAKYVAAAILYNDAQDFGASPETWPSLEQAEKEAESALLLAVRDATLKAERARLLALTEESVVEAADYEARMAYRHFKPTGMMVGPKDEMRISAAVRAALPVLLAPTHAKLAEVEKDLREELGEHADTIRGEEKATERYIAAEAEVARLRGALKELRGFFGVVPAARVSEDVALTIIRAALAEGGRDG